jgi:hypothetical protein
VLAVYTSLSVRRSLWFGRHLAAAPTYDPETTGLLIYNDLVLGGKAAVPQELRASILKTRVLTRCKTAGQSREQLGQDLQEILQHLVSRLDANNAEAEGLAALDHALEGLCAEGLLTAENDHYELTDAGLDKVLEYAAGSARLEEQFTASIRTRAELRASGLGIDPAKPTEVVAGFFRDAIERRALGVALAFATGASPAQQDYHALALLQSLGTWLDTATSEADALVVVETVQEIFREPSEAESTYIAMSVQARFVLHVLSLDNDTLAVRLRDVQDSLFLIDASTLIPWLAVGSKGNAAAKSLVARLQEAGATMATTRPLSEEVAEHARWAQKTVSGDGPVQSLGVFEAATGRAGIKTNAFLQGYLELYAIQPTASSFDEYLASCLGVARVGNPLTDRELSAALSDRGVVALNFDALSTKVPTLSADRDSYVIQVRSKRRASASFTHERQVRAEAEAVALVEHARAGCADLVGAAVGNAYFVSYTSMLNQIAKSPLPVTMRPEAALAWLMMIKPAASEDVTALMSELLWELEERRMNIVDQTALLTAFGPLITAARERLDDVLPKYQVLIAERYGGDYSWPTAINDLDAPVVLESVLHDQVVGLERDLAVATKELERMRSAGQINEQDRKELERARSKEKGRKRYERRMKRQRGSE